jgi:hypothetical protein
MGILDDRERAFEAKFAHENEVAFRISTLRDRMLGMWAANLMGKSEDEARAYADALLREDLMSFASARNDETIVNRLATDLDDVVGIEIIKAQRDIFSAAAISRVEQGH